MITKNINKIKETFTFKNIADTFSSVNSFALATTENYALRGIDSITKWQDSADKALKNGLAYNAKKQEVIFDSLDSAKETVVKTFNKTKKRFVKK